MTFTNTIQASDTTAVINPMFGDVDTSALQFRVHSLQFTHLSVSITGFNQEKRASKPSTVPTGHTVLQ